ncbi:MAG: hypothetical protein F6K58_23315 [Symploca sp. SIO2E9]|nr:hypothetical protein [Symploca sp. SIO2E9]
MANNFLQVPSLKSRTTRLILSVPLSCNFLIALAAVNQQITPGPFFKNLVSINIATYLLEKADVLETQDNFQAGSQENREVRGSGRLRIKIW